MLKVGHVGPDNYHFLTVVVFLTCDAVFSHDIPNTNIDDPRIPNFFRSKQGLGEFHDGSGLSRKSDFLPDKLFRIYSK